MTDEDFCGEVVPWDDVVHELPIYLHKVPPDARDGYRGGKLVWRIVRPDEHYWVFERADSAHAADVRRHWRSYRWRCDELNEGERP